MTSPVFLFFQLLNLAILIGYAVLLFFSVKRINHQFSDISSRLVWYFVVLFIPFGAVLPFVVFRETEKRKNDDMAPSKVKRNVGETTLEELLLEDVEEKQKFRA